MEGRNLPISGSRQPQVPPNAKRRRINGRACINCHQRKVRCDVLDKGSPCTNCRSQNRRDCQIYEKKKTRSSTRSVRSHVAIQPRGHHQPPIAPRTPVSTSSRSNGRRPSGAESESSASHTGEAGGTEEPDPGNLAEFIAREELRVAEINSHSRMCFIGSELSNISYLVRQHSRTPGHDGRVHFGSRVMDFKYISLHELKRPVAVSRDLLELPEKTLADQLLRAYFDHVNRGWPIVDEDDFMCQYRNNHAQLPLMNAIFLVGAHVLASPSRPEMKELKARFFRRAKTLIDCRSEQDRVMYVQVALLMTWHSDGQEDIIANCWHWVGMAARAALGLGMHRDTSKSSMILKQKRLWVRLWWVLFQLDVMVSLAYGRPQALHLDDTDVPEPDHSHFEGTSNMNAEFSIQHTRLCIIISRTMRQRIALRSSQESRDEATRQGDKDLADFMVALPEQFRLPLSGADIWQSTLNLTYNNFLILVHRPRPKPEVHLGLEPGSASDSSICGDAMTIVTSTLESLRARGELSKLWWCGMHALFTAIVQVSEELESANPLVRAKSSRTFDSLLLSLRELAKQWLYAQSLLRLFEERASRAGTQQRRPVQADPPSQVQSPEEAPRFSLRPQTLSQQPTQYFGNLAGEPATTATASMTLSSSVATNAGHYRVSNSHGGRGHYHSSLPTPHGANDAVQSSDDHHHVHLDPGDPTREHVYDNEYFSEGMSMIPTGGDMMLLNGLPLPEASALEYLLAGTYDGDFGYGYGN